MEVCFSFYNTTSWCCSPVKRACSKETLNKVEAFWTYGDKIAGLIRSLMMASLKMPHAVTAAFQQRETRVLAVVARLKLFTALNVFFNIKAVGAVFNKVIHEIMHRDLEGIGLASISFSLIVMDSIDQFTTCVNALLPMLSKAPFALLDAINLPLSFVILGLSTLYKMIQVIKVQRVYDAFQGCSKNTHGQHIEFDLNKFGEFYQNLLNVSTHQERSKQILERYMPKEILGHLTSLSSMIRSGTIDNSQMAYLIASITGHFKKKISEEIGNMIVNALFILAVSLFAMSVATAVPYMVLAGAFICKLAMISYADFL